MAPLQPNTLEDRLRPFVRAIRKFDILGDSVRTHPSRYPKTFSGAIVSAFCIGLTATLITLDVIKLANSASGEVSGRKI